MEAYLEDNRPTIDEVCESYDECNKECPLYYIICHPQERSRVNKVEDYAIVNDDLFAIAKSIRKGTPFDDIETLKHRSYLEGFHKAHQMYYKLFDDIRQEITDKSFTANDGTEVIDCLVVMDIIDRHTKGAE